MYEKVATQNKGHLFFEEYLNTNFITLNIPNRTTGLNQNKPNSSENNITIKFLKLSKRKSKKLTLPNNEFSTNPFAL
jgi:hypothetical protein